MTALIVSVGRDRVQLVTDGLAFIFGDTPDGDRENLRHGEAKIAFHATKVRTVPALNAAIAAAGVYGLLYALHSMRTYDDVGSWAESGTIEAEIAALGFAFADMDAPVPIQLVVASCSRDGPKVWCTFDGRFHRLGPGECYVMPPVSREVAPVPRADEVGSIFRRKALAVIEAQRDQRCMIGGAITQTTITADSVLQPVIHRYPDRIGAVIGRGERLGAV